MAGRAPLQWRVFLAPGKIVPLEWLAPAKTSDHDINHSSIYLTAKASSFLPPLSAATSHLGRLPRPAQVSLRFLGLR